MAKGKVAQKEAKVSSPESLDPGELDFPGEKSLPVTVLNDVTHTVRTSARTEPKPTRATSQCPFIAARMGR